MTATRTWGGVLRKATAQLLCALFLLPPDALHAAYERGASAATTWRAPSSSASAQRTHELLDIACLDGFGDGLGESLDASFAAELERLLREEEGEGSAASREDIDEACACACAGRQGPDPRLLRSAIACEPLPLTALGASRPCARSHRARLFITHLLPVRLVIVRLVTVRVVTLVRVRAPRIAGIHHLERTRFKDRDLQAHAGRKALIVVGVRSVGRGRMEVMKAVFYQGGQGPQDLSGGYLSGEVYDDETGRPLSNASATLAGVGARTTEGRGRYVFTGDVTAGRYALELTKNGYTKVTRRLSLEPGIGVVPFDARLTPLSPAQAYVIANGGTFGTPATSLELTPNALPPGADLAVRVTPLSGQGLPEPLPPGYTPLVAGDVRIEEGSGANTTPLPESTVFGGTQRLTMTLPAGVDTAARLIAVRYEPASGVWMTLASPERSVAGNGQEKVSVVLPSPGSVAVVVADTGATAPPVVADGAGHTLFGAPAPEQVPALTGTLTLDPPVVLPTGRATAKVVARSADETTPWPSGLATSAYLDERLVLSTGEELFEAPFAADLFLYRGTNASAVEGEAEFRVSPSPKAAEVLLETGHENIRLFPFSGPLERGQVLGPNGGGAASADGAEIVLAEGALSERVPVSIRLLTSDERAAYIVAGYDVLVGINLDLAGRTLARPATLRLPIPSGAPSDDVADPRLVLAEWIGQPADNRGAFARLTARAARGGTPVKYVAGPEAAGSTLPLEGVAREGIYLLLRVQASIGYATGLVKAASGTGLMGARTSTSGLGTADLTVPGGTYALVVPAGTSRVVEARHPTLDERGTATIPSVAAGQVVTGVDITVVAQGPSVISVQPADNATNQPIGSVVSVRFSEPIDPSSVGSSTLRLELANADGASSGVFILGAVTLSTDQVTVVLTPSRPLPPGRKLIGRFTGGIRDAGGTPYTGAAVTWSFTTSTQVVVGGQVHPEKIRLLIPLNGVAQVIGEPGALPLVTAGTTPWSVRAEVDAPIACSSTTTTPADPQGGFTTSAGCPPAISATIASKIYLKVFDPTGTLAEQLRLGPFTSPDGKTFIAPAGEETVYTTPAPDSIQVTVPAAAFDEPTPVTIKKLDPSTLSAIPLNPPMEIGAYVSVDFEGTANETLRVKVPVTSSASVGSLVIAGEPITLPWGERLRILELGKIVDSGSGQRLVSNHEADQPTPVAAVGTTSRLAALAEPVQLPTKLLRTTLLELMSRAQAVFLTSTGAELSVVAGNAMPSLLLDSTAVLYNTLADTFIYKPIPFNWSGYYILPVPADQPFTLVERSSSTGWILGEQTYDPVGGGLRGVPPFTAADPKTAPRLIDARPFTLIHFASPKVDGCQPPGAPERLSLELTACASTQGTTISAVSEYPFADHTRLSLYNTKKGYESDAATTNTNPVEVLSETFAPTLVKADEGDELLALVMPGDVDPEVGELVLVFDRALTADASEIGKLYDCGAVSTATCGALGTASAPEVATEADLLGGTFRLTLQAALTRGHRYALDLEPEKLRGGGPEPYKGPARLFFATRGVTGQPIGTAAGSLIGTNLARDMVKIGQLLVVGTGRGDIVALDVSDPRNIRRHAVSAESGDQVRAFASDGHGRVFYSALHGATWGVGGLRIEDIRDPQTPCATPIPEWAGGTPCFAPVLGGVKVAYSISSSVLGTEYLALSGSLPVGTPTSMEILVEDDTSKPKELRDFYEEQNGAGTFSEASQDSRGIYTFGIDVDTSGRRPGAYETCTGQAPWYHFQRVSVDNLTTGESWSFEVENPWPEEGSGGTGKLSKDDTRVRVLRGRRGDMLRVRYNLRAYGYLAVVGGGITVLDLNRVYKTPLEAQTQQTKSSCGKRLGNYSGSELELPECGGLANYEGITMTPAVALLSSESSLDVYSPLLHYGAVHSSSSLDRPGDLLGRGKECLMNTGRPRPSFRDVVVAKDVPDLSGPGKPARHLMFLSAGPWGVFSYDVTDRSLTHRIGRFGVPGHWIYRLQLDEKRGRLYAGGDGFIDVFDITLAEGEPTGETDHRLLFSVKARWDAEHIALDESGSGLLYSWDNLGNQGLGEGLVIPVDEPEVLFAGLYRGEGQGPASVSRLVGEMDAEGNVPHLAPLGIPVRVSAASEREKAAEDEKNVTAAVRLRVALPGVFSETVNAKVESLRVLPEGRSLAKNDAGPALAEPGGLDGWPKNTETVRLRRLSTSSPTGPNGRLSVTHSLYESEDVLILLADPRAKQGYTRQGIEGESASEKAECRRCARPDYLADPSLTVKELLAGGPYLRAVVDDPLGPSVFRESDYRNPAGVTGLVGFADDVPSVHQASLAEPALNAAIWEGEAGAMVSLVAGEALLSASDLFVKGRSLGFSLDRSYRSGRLGYSPLGSAGWTSSLLSHVRRIPLVAELLNGQPRELLEWHAGDGRVFRFYEAVGERGGCPTKHERDGAWCVPKGLYVRPEKVAGGYRIVGQTHDSLLFDTAGRLSELTDRHARPNDESVGNRLRLTRDAFGRLSSAEDEMGRTYRFRHHDEPLAPHYGLLREVEDFDQRKVEYLYDESRKLTDVKLPEVTLAGTNTRPQLTYTYRLASFGTEAPHHGELSGTRLEGLKLPAHPANPSRVERVKFNYQAAGRVSDLEVPLSSPWAFTYTPATAAPAQSAVVTSPWALVTDYSLDSGRTVSTTLQNVEVAKDGPPEFKSVTTTAHYSTDDSGRLERLDRGDGSVAEWTFPSSGDRLSRLNLTLFKESGAGNEITRSFNSYSADNLLELAKDGEGRSIEMAVAEARAEGKDAGYSTDGVFSKHDFDPFGRRKKVKAGTGSQTVITSMVYGADPGGRQNAGYLKELVHGEIGAPLKTTFKTDARGNVTDTEASQGTLSTAIFDTWDRPVNETLGIAKGGPDLESVGGSGAEITREYDAAGHLVKETRTQKNVGTVTTTYLYDARERLESVTVDKLAGQDPSGGFVEGTTRYAYNVTTGLLTSVTSPAGVVTSYTHDKAGRVKTEQTGLAVARTVGYDELGRPSYEHDGDAAEWKGTWDSFGRLERESLPHRRPPREDLRRGRRPEDPDSQGERRGRSAPLLDHGEGEELRRPREPHRASR